MQFVLQPSATYWDFGRLVNIQCTANIGSVIYYPDVSDGVSTVVPSGERITAEDCAEVAKAVNAVQMTGTICGKNRNPTMRPTKKPTRTPTKRPTKRPTRKPTRKPTKAA